MSISAPTHMTHTLQPYIRRDDEITYKKFDDVHQRSRWITGAPSVVYNDSNVHITSQTFSSGIHTYIETTNTAENIRITLDSNDKIVAIINGKTIPLPTLSDHISSKGYRNSLFIEKNGDDTVSIDERVKIEVSVKDKPESDQANKKDTSKDKKIVCPPYRPRLPTTSLSQMKVAHG